MDKQGGQTAMVENIHNHSVYDEENGLIFGSLTKGSDLMEGIIQEYEKYDVHSGVVTCIGSLSQAAFVYLQNDESGKLSYSELLFEEGPIELIKGSGFLCENKHGQTDFHLHALFGNQHGKLFGGHIFPGKNPTLITVEFSIQVGKGIEAVRTFKPQLGFQTITFQKGESELGDIR
ncbi:putative DNA-binding protein with PD1-like motif [Bacillus pakistanensis]|uniref:DNA-binding protein with PD1-like motif n=1 Tax=Rossellomorea pakistanensis TaxID=992288 RepID=A0ABS2NH66_9BACI|nr:DUF296 domain-containing protein [Bacillus pakistanensis]MBM7587163.1 putative DNA-binding protein with PD1-like motif [Bacillus pakistanensis]